MYDYYRGSNLYLDAVQNQLKSIFEETGFPISSQDNKTDSGLANSIQANTDAIKKMESGIQTGIAASAVTMYGMSQGIRSDIQANTDAIQNAAVRIRSDIRESAYATLKMGLELSNDIQNNTNVIQDMATGLNSAIRENTYTLIASQRMLQETITKGFGAFVNAMGIGFDITNKNLAEAVKKLDEIHDILNNPLLTQSRELYRRALDNYKRGLYEEALEDGLGAVEKNKTDFISWYLLGHIYLFGAGKFSNVIDVDKAEEAFQTAAKYIDYDLGKSEEANNLGSEIYYYLGYARLIKSNDLLIENKNEESVKKLEEAVRASSESYRLSDKNLVAVYEQAKELHFLGRDDEALQIIENLIHTEKDYAYRAVNDKNFESLWSQIENIIKRLAYGMYNEMILVLEDLSAQVHQLTTSIYFTETIESHHLFQSLLIKLPHCDSIQNKGYFIIRDYYEKDFLDYKALFENGVYPFFNVQKQDWEMYNQILNLFNSGKKEECLKELESLIRSNVYFAIKSTCDRKLEPLRSDIESLIENLKKELCQAITEKIESSISPFEDIIKTDTELANYSVPSEVQQGHLKNVGELFNFTIETFRSPYKELEKESYFSVRNKWEKKLPESLQITLALDSCIRETRGEIENKKRLEKQEEERKQREEEERKQREEEQRIRDADFEAECLKKTEYNEKTKRKCTLIGILIGLIIGLAVCFVLVHYDSGLLALWLTIIYGIIIGLVLGILEYGIVDGIIGGAVFSLIVLAIAVFFERIFGEKFSNIVQMIVGFVIPGGILGYFVGNEVFKQKFEKY